MTPSPLIIRGHAQPQDLMNVRRIVSHTGFFSQAEVDIALELVQEAVRRGEKSGYCFLFAQLDNRIVGFVCFGPTPCTLNTFDIYWIAVEPESRGRSIGSQLLSCAENAIRQRGGGRIFVETSSRHLYAPTRRFYETRGYRAEASFKDFYAPRDSKVVYVKNLNRSSQRAKSGKTLPSSWPQGLKSPRPR